MRSWRRSEGTASRSRRPFSRRLPFVRNEIVFQVVRIRPGGLPFSPPWPADLRKVRGNVLRPPASRVLQNERKGDEEDEGHEKAVPTVLWRFRVAPTPGAT